MCPLARKYLPQYRRIVLHAQAAAIHPDIIPLPRHFQPDGFPTRRDLNAGLLQQLQQFLQAGGLLRKGRVNRHAELVPVAGRFAALPLAVAPATPLGILHDGVAVFDADCIAEPPHRPAGAEEITEFLCAVQCGRVPDDVVVDMLFVDMGADDKGMVPFGEAPRQLTAQAVGLFRRNLPWHKGLADGIGNHIVPAAPPAGPGKVLPLGEKKFRIGNAAVTLVAGDQSAIAGFIGILNIINDIADGFSSGPAYARVQGCNPCGGDRFSSLFRIVLLIFLKYLPCLFHKCGIAPAHSSVCPCLLGYDGCVSGRIILSCERLPVLSGGQIINARHFLTH